MITGELKNKIDGLWDIFAAGGLVNPLEVIAGSLFYSGTLPESGGRSYAVCISEVLIVGYRRHRSSKKGSDLPHTPHFQDQRKIPDLFSSPF